MTTPMLTLTMINKMIEGLPQVGYMFEICRVVRLKQHELDNRLIDTSPHVHFIREVLQVVDYAVRAVYEEAWTDPHNPRVWEGGKFIRHEALCVVIVAESEGVFVRFDTTFDEQAVILPQWAQDTPTNGEIKVMPFKWCYEDGSQPSKYE